MRLEDACPRIWFPLGMSGWKMHVPVLRHIETISPELVSTIQVSKADYLRESDSITFEPSIEGETFGNKPVLIIDSAIHSGRSMLLLSRNLIEAGANKIISYSLVIKNNSLFVPTYFGVVIDEKDRTYFDLDQIPNNRLHDKKALVGTLRVLTEDDADKVIEVGDPFKGLCVGDLLYDKETRSSHIFGYEQDSKLIAFLSFRKAGMNVFIDAIGVEESHRGEGIASAMLRWAETWGRSVRCTGVQLWAYEKAISMYQLFGYKPVTDEWRTLGLGHRYKLMEKPLLYSIKITGEGDDQFRGQGD